MATTDPHNAAPQPVKPHPPVLDYARPGVAVSRRNVPAVLGVCCVVTFAAVLASAIIYDSTPLPRHFGKPSGFLNQAIGFILILSSPPVAIVLAGLGLWHAHRNYQRGRFAAIAALSVGLLQLFILYLMIPPQGTAKERAFRVRCCSNLTSIGTSIQLYLNDSHGVFPPDLGLLFIQTDLSASVFVCPSSDDEPAEDSDPKAVAQKMLKEKGHLSYIYVYPGPEMRAGRLSADCILAYEPLINHFQEGMNILFSDGHAEWFDKTQATYLIAELNAGFNPPRPQRAPLGGASPTTR
jgi:prepilin-type processing-associated H-X9-DG protein